MCAQALITGDLVQFRAGSPPDEACAWTCSPGATGGSTTSRCRSPGGEDFAAQSEVADRILSTLTPEEVESLNVLTEKIIHQCKDMGVRGERKHGRHHRHGKGRSCRK